MPNVILMGDSILDNQHYVGNDDPDVMLQLAARLTPDWTVTRVAVDGATTKSLPHQIANVPEDATHLVVSIGGNDAMGHVGILSDRKLVHPVDTLAELAWIAFWFGESYAEAMDEILTLGLPVTVCTIYDCDFPMAERDAVLAALSVFNDVILRYALTHGLNVLDLRPLCTSPSDYECQIEPSVHGGAKIAEGIFRAITGGRAYPGIMAQ
jgi:GDSL-like Lipase/Acylhydrolase family